MEAKKKYGYEGADKIKTRHRNDIIRALSEGKKTFKELGETTELSPPALTAHIQELEKEGRISYDVDPEDRRKRIYKIIDTPPGRVGQFWRALNSRLLDPMTSNQTKRLSELLDDETIDTSVEIVKKCFERYQVGSEEGLEPLFALWFYESEKDLLDTVVETMNKMAGIFTGKYSRLIRRHPNRAAKLVRDEFAKEAKVIPIVKNHGLTQKFDELGKFLNEVISNDNHWIKVKERTNSEYRKSFVLPLFFKSIDWSKLLKPEVSKALLEE